MANYRHAQFAELARQLLKYSPRPRKLQQLARIRAFALSLQPSHTYPYDYVCYQITRFKPGDAPHAVFAADDLLADLMALHHELSDSIDLPVEWAEEPVLTLEEVRRTYDVSLKTVRRWRSRGLVAFRFVFEDGRKLTGIRQSDLEGFVEAHPDIMERTGAYTYIDGRTRRALIARAFELSLAEELTLAEAVGRLAREFGCSHGSARALLRRYDREHPEAPIFAKAARPLPEAERRQIHALYRDGLDADRLARAFLLGRTTVQRVVRDLTIEDILDREWYYVASPDFARPDADALFLAEPLPAHLDERSFGDPLSPEQEQALFRRYNYLKYRLARARDELAPSDLTPERIAEILDIYHAAVATRNCLVVANLRLVVHLSGRHVAPGRPLDELVSDGTVSLMQAIERFDYSRGVRFSTYASWAIRKNFAKTIPQELHARTAAMTSAQEIIDGQPAPQGATAGQREFREVLRSTVATLLLELGPREREILAARFGLGREQETLEQIGERFDITRERVRQIEARALRKLAGLADPALINDIL